MEEYKKIAKQIAVPSFFTLLPACSVIFLTYSFLFVLKISSAIGIALFFISIISIFFYTKYFQQSNFITFGLIPVIVSFSILIRILLLTGYMPVNDKSTVFTATVNSVLSQRYSNEVIISFRDLYNSENIAVSYTSKEIKLNPGDILEISARPKEIKNHYYDNSSFEINLLRKGFHFIFYLNERNIRIKKESGVSLKDKIRKSIEANFRILFDKKTIPVLKGLYFANPTYIDKSTTNDFRRAGVLHILAASGEHIGIGLSPFPQSFPSLPSTSLSIP